MIGGLAGRMGRRSIGSGQKDDWQQGRHEWV